MKRLSFLLLFPLVIPATGQVERAPASDVSAQQCRADADSWGIPPFTLPVAHEGQFSKFGTAVRSDRKITAEMLDLRDVELAMCMKQDSQQSVRYSKALRADGDAETARMVDFLERHKKLRAQFYREDEQGKR
jgi:hypothetical protein